MEDRVLTQIPQVPAEDKGLSAQVIPAGQMLNKANRALFCLANSRTMINAFFVFYISFSVWMTLHDFQFCASGRLSTRGGKFDKCPLGTNHEDDMWYPKHRTLFFKHHTTFWAQQSLSIFFFTDLNHIACRERTMLRSQTNLHH